MPLEVTSLTLGDLTTTGKGTKQIPLRCKDGLLRFQPGSLRVLWQPAAYNEPSATRVPICFEATPEVEDYINTLDDWMVKKLATDSNRFFGQALTVEQVREKYTSCIKTSQKGYKHLKAKMNISGRASARFWNHESKKPTGPPEDWTRCEVEPVLEIRGLWFLGKEMGLLVELTDALISETSVVCPF